MKWTRRIIYVLMMAAVLIAESMASREVTDANNAGSYSEVCGVITQESEDWVLDVFGEHDTLEELLWALDKFACENFVYTTDSLDLSQKFLQHFDMQRFLESGFRGICFDFSCFCKNVILIWCEAQGEEVQVFVCETMETFSSGHAYNYIIDSHGTTWYLDTTSDSTHYQQGNLEGCWGPVPLVNTTAQEFNELLYPDGYWYTLMR